MNLTKVVYSCPNVVDITSPVYCITVWCFCLESGITMNELERMGLKILLMVGLGLLSLSIFMLGLAILAEPKVVWFPS